MFDSRCGRFIASDGFTRGVDYDNEDRFCLDGSRLVAVSGNYGDDQSEYRTEIDSYRKVVAFSSTGSSEPDTFKVQTKDNKIMKYGISTNSKIKGQNQIVTHAWLLSSVSDYHGNIIEIAYLNRENGFYVSNITYKTMTIAFKYENRNDKASVYFKGSVLQNRNVRLSEILVSVEQNLYRSLSLSYTDSGPAEQSIPYSIHCVV